MTIHEQMPVQDKYRTTQRFLYSLHDKEHNGA